MKQVKLFIAMSLDGYIADSNGSVDWLGGHGRDDDSENPDVYAEFVKDIDTVLMGWKTYDQITHELSPNDWVYKDLTTYVITHRNCTSSDMIKFTNQNPIDLVKGLKKEEKKDIWICGGANLIQQLIDEDMIDAYYITVIPVILGSGVRLFGNESREIPLKLIKTQSYNGMTDLIYARRMKV